MVKNFVELEQAIGASNNKPDVETIFVIITIEGMHDWNAGTGDAPVEQEIMQNLAKLKAWQHKPFFVTFAHHFYNELCGHAESLSIFLFRTFFPIRNWA